MIRSDHSRILPFSVIDNTQAKRLVLDVSKTKFTGTIWMSYWCKSHIPFSPLSPSFVAHSGYSLCRLISDNQKFQSRCVHSTRLRSRGIHYQITGSIGVPKLRHLLIPLSNHKNGFLISIWIVGSVFFFTRVYCEHCLSKCILEIVVILLLSGQASIYVCCSVEHCNEKTQKGREK